MAAITEGMDEWRTKACIRFEKKRPETVNNIYFVDGIG